MGSAGVNTLNTKSPPPGWREGTIHVAYVRIAIALADQLGIATTTQTLKDGAMASLLDVSTLLQALGVLENPQRGLALGNLIPASAHGAMGYAVVSSPTVGEALSTIARYAGMRNRLFTYHFQNDTNEAVLSIKPRLEMAGFRAFAEITTAVSLFKMVQGVAGEKAASLMEFDAHWESYGALDVFMQLRYAQPVTALRVPAKIAELELPTADAKLYANACRSCEEELATLNGSIVGRLRSIMPNDRQEWPSLEHAAEQFSMSPRTLIRKLVAEGLTFQTLQDQIKSELACWYLSHTTLPMGEISERLGFSDDTNFSRSFRRWRNTTPFKYRNSTPKPIP